MNFQLFSFHSIRPLWDKVKKWKKVDPHNVNKMPIESCIFKSCKVFTGNLLFEGKKKHEGNYDDSDKDMESMYPGHYIVKAKKEDFSFGPLQEYR